jgi:fatty-acyl-CoA synthase
VFESTASCRRTFANVVSDDRDAHLSVVSCGRPFPGHRLGIVDGQGRALPDRHVGEIVLSGPSVMAGYYKQEALSAEAVSAGWLRTGDLGYVADGELFVCGRLKDVISIHGRRYHPQDLEYGLDDLTGVRRGRVVAFAASASGQPDRVVVVVEAKGTVPALELARAVRRRISDLCGLYVDDVQVVPAGTIPLTTSGKLQRAAVKAQYERGELLAEESQCPKMTSRRS